MIWSPIMAEVSLRAHAKVNLALALAAPEPPGAARAGWHRICTWMHAIDLADEVRLEPLPEGGVSTWSAAWAPDAPRPGLIDWPCAEDLAWRALRAVEDHLGRRLPTRIVLTKRIPTGSGLGGGSADAAAALVGIDRAWGLGLGPATLGQLGATLGSDVPFFIDHQYPPRPGIVSGFGETIERTSRTLGEVILLMPRFGCPTGRVYGAFDTLAAQEHKWRFEESRVRRLAEQRGVAPTALFNDLANPACAVQPALGQLRAKATEVLGCPVHVSGSGSTLFVLPPEGRAGRLAETARDALPGVAVWPTRLL
ncbi:4-diphosphocytidyl-2-C-methyl-D-erythritol kinase [hydrothermal vent metagenome]|uniref:4-diphosphocytidyl-2-C-methyl-D-erythritol kinase n=1 Tax=hydrothermal vent metagenome TaxID=652676 RepID=A0A3B1E0U5_9ZZZZ